MVTTTQCPDSVNAAALSFIDRVIASWHPKEQPAESIEALLAQIAEVQPVVVIDARDGSELFDDDELERYGYCDMQISKFIRYPKSVPYLRGSLKAAQH